MAERTRIRMMLARGARLAGVLAPLSLLAASPVADAALPYQPPLAAILVAAGSGETLYADAADAVLHPASITKMMTLYLAFEAIQANRLKLNDRVEFSRFAVNQRPSRLGVRAGTTMSVDEVVRAITVKSANDAAVALAEKIDGSEAAFAAHMTREARKIGMLDSQFVNASGLSHPDHVTTARDIALLSVTLIRRFPVYYRYFSERSFDYGKQKFANHNHLLGRTPGVDGIKTGYTLDAGFTLAASASRGGTRLVAVVLGEPSARVRDMDVERLLNAGYAVLDARKSGRFTTVAANFSGLTPRQGLGALQ